MSRVVCLLKALLIFILFATFQTTQAQLIISEFMASNTRTLLDEDGDTSDWIEVFNLGQTNVNLSGWALTDSSGNPRKWRFPSMDLRAGDNIIVFASGKNRRIAGSPLHTDFKLSSSPGYLGLTDPSGVIVFDYGAQYSEQAPDISFGVVWEENRFTILATNAPAKFFVPTDDFLADGWTALEYPMDNWQPAIGGGIGYDQNASALDDPWLTAHANLGPQIFYRFEDSGVTVVNSGSWGPPYNATFSGVPLTGQIGLRPPEAEGLPTNNVTPRFDGVNDYMNSAKPALNNLSAFTMGAWVRPALLSKPRVGLWGQHDAVEFGFIDAHTLQLLTASGGAVQAEFPLPSNTWRYVAVTGDGELLRIYIDGVMVAEGGNSTGNYGASAYPFVIGGGGVFDATQNWFTGMIDEFSLFTNALTADDIFLLYKSANAPAVTYASSLGLDVGTALKGVNTSLYARYEFIFTNSVEGLVLDVQSDDGFVAYLNGVEVARNNAPDEPFWNSTATATRTDRSGLRGLEFDISHYAGLLHNGNNLLAIHALNAAIDDADFLIRPELIGISRNVQTNAVRYFVVPSPGRINGVGDTNAGPLIVSANHSPKIPETNQSVTVTARMIRTFNLPSELTLTYRVMFGAETNVSMKDDGLNGDGVAGDGIYGVRIPASIATQGQMIRWYFRAKDTVGNTSRWPLYRETLNSPQYLGTIINDTRLTNPLPVLHWFIQNTSAADGTTGTRSSLFWNGVLYDNIFVNLHGQSSSGFPKKSYNFDFNTGFHFAWDDKETPVEDINLLTTYPDKAHIRNVLSYEVYRNAGHAYHWVVPVRVQRNAAFFSDAHMVEDGDEDYLARVGLDPNGALYKMYNTLDSSTSGVEKKSRKFESNIDLQELINGLARSGAAQTAYVYDNVNIPAMANYLAAMIITGNVDCCHKNYYLFRDSEGTREWQFLPWDVDLSFGRVWNSTQTYFDDTMIINTGLNVGDNNKLPQVLFANAAFKQMYLRRIRTLMDEQIQPPGTPAADLKIERRVAELYAQIAPDAALDFAKWATWGTPQTLAQAAAILTNTYMTGRRNFLYVTEKGVIPAAITNDVVLKFGAFDANPFSGTQLHEYLSLTNTNKVAIDISGWQLDGGVRHTFAPGTVIPSNGALYVSPDVNGFRQRINGPRGGQGLFIQGNYKGQLSSRGDIVYLVDKAGKTNNVLTYVGFPTFAQDQLRITEILFAPPANSAGIAREETEYVVLRNIGQTAINLKGVHFTNGVNFNIGIDFTLQPSNTVYVAKNPDAFRTVYGNNLPVVGPYIGQLANEGEPLELYDGFGESVLDFTYDNKWYPLTETRGHSLLVVDDKTPYTNWSVKETWTFSPLPGGSAAIAQSWLNYQKTYFSAEEISAGVITAAAADPDGDGLSNYDEFIAGVNPRDVNSCPHVTVLSATGSSLQVQFPVVIGRFYSVWSATHTDGPWTREPGSFRATGTGNYATRLDSPVDVTKFYRLRTEL